MRRAATIGLIVAASVLLTACFLLPGKFSSTLDIRRDGQFDFTYSGEMVVATADAMNGVAGAVSTTCYGTVPGGPPPIQPPAAPLVPGTTRVAPVSARPCTADEIAKRTAEAAAARRQSGARFAQLTGIDPSDPATMRAFAAELTKEAGWRSVVYRGDGVFDVDYRQAGRLDRDFIFPVLPRGIVIVPFVVVHKRADAAVLVDAPGFVANAAAALARGLNAGSGGSVMAASDHGPAGRFELTTDAAPLTNNTADGPSRVGDRSRLTWTVTPASDRAPEALVPLK